MNTPKIVSQAEWLSARKELLAREKEFTRLRDALAEQLRKLPMVRVEKEYMFDGPDGSVSLRDLFGPHAQLIVYHFMFDPDWNEGCKSCSMFADNFSGAIRHLPARNTAFAVISKAPVAKLEAFKKRMGWTFPWYSSSSNTFNRDFHVTVDTTAGDEYNYHDAGKLKQAGKLWIERGELPGLSVFLKDGEALYHTYSTYQRGLDIFLNTYNFLDVTPLGRQEEHEPYVQSWVRHHDRYSA